MAIVYFDASALVKLVLDEPGSDLAADLWDGCDAALTSRLTHPEVCAALAAAGRNHDLDQDDLVAALGWWEELRSAIRPVELTSKVESDAGGLAANHGLRGADAVHLASALAVGDDGLVLAVWDRRLHAAARTVGLAVSPPSITATG